MPRLTASKDEVKGPAPLPEGLYTVRLDGFKPKAAKKGGSVNLNPTLKVVNSAEFNDRYVFENLNSKGPWIWPDFHHCFGVDITKDAEGNYEFVGFGPDGEDNPEKWTYGPEHGGQLSGRTGQVYLVQTDNGSGGVKTAIKYYVCAMPNCSEKHSANLVKS